METMRPHLTANVHHLGLKLAAVATAIATYLVAGGATSTYAAVAALAIGAGFAVELVWSARGEEISPAVRWRYLIVATAALALVVVYRHPTFHYKLWAELGLAGMVALCSWELVARIRGRLAPATGERLEWVSLAAPTAADTRDPLEAFLARDGGRFMVVAENGEGSHVRARFLIGFPSRRAKAVRAYIKQTLGADKSMNVRDVRELLPHERLLVERWADGEGVAPNEVEWQGRRALPELADVAAYQLRFRAQQGAGLLALNEGQHVFDAYSPELLEAAARPEVAAAMVIVDLAEVPASTKRGLTAQMTQMLDDGETLRLRVNGLRGGGLPALLRWAFVIGGSFTASYLLHSAWPLVIPVLLALFAFWKITLKTAAMVVQVGRFLITGEWKPLGLVSLDREPLDDRQLTDEEKETKAFMKKKRDGRLFTGAAYVVVIPSAHLNGEDDHDGAAIAAVVDEAATSLARAVIDATADSRTGGALEAEKLEDARRAFTGDLPRHGDTRFLLKPSEAASMIRPLDISANEVFHLDQQAVPSLGVPKHAQREGEILLGRAAPESADEQPLAINLRDANGGWFTFGNTRMGKTVRQAAVIADAIVNGAPAAVIDPANMCETVLAFLADKDPSLLESEDILFVDWSDRKQIPYWNPMVARNDDEVDLAINHTMDFIQSIVGDISSQAPRAIGYLEAIVPPVVKFNQDIDEKSIASGRDPDDAFHASMLAVYTILEEDNADLLWAIVARYGNHTQQQRWSRYFEMLEQNAKQAASEYLVIQQRLERVFNVDQLARIMGSPKNRIDFEQVILGSKKQLHKVPVIGGQKVVGGSILGLLGIMFADASWTVMERLKRESGGTPPMHALGIDEAHNAARVAPGQFIRMLREMAKTGLCLMAASQHPEQFRGYKDEEGNSVYDEMWQVPSMTAFRTSVGAKALADKLDPTHKKITPEMVQTIEPYHALELHTVVGAGGKRRSLGPVAVAAPAPPEFLETADGQRWFNELVQRTREIGYRLICRPVDVAAWEVDHQTIREQLIAELERIHGPQALSLPLGELPARPARPSAPSTPSAPSAVPSPAQPSGADDEDEPADDPTASDVADEHDHEPAVEEPRELELAPEPDVAEEAEASSHRTVKADDDPLGWDDLEDIA